MQTLLSACNLGLQSLSMYTPTVLYKCSGFAVFTQALGPGFAILQTTCQAWTDADTWRGKSFFHSLSCHRSVLQARRCFGRLNMLQRRAVRRPIGVRFACGLHMRKAVYLHCARYFSLHCELSERFIACSDSKVSSA